VSDEERHGEWNGERIASRETVLNGGKVRRWGVSGVLNIRGEWEAEKFREVSKGPEKKETFKPKKGVSFLIFFFFFFFFFF
jgi:hypothetical protein